MIFMGVSSVRTNDRIQPVARFPVPIAFITFCLLLGVGFCTQGGNGLVVGVYNGDVGHARRDMSLKFKRGAELGTDVDSPSIF